MAKFFVGQRIKKVRGERNIGNTGTVVAVGLWPKGYIANGWISGLKNTADIQVREDQEFSNSQGSIFKAGSIAYTNSGLWEPILAQHQPCEAEFKESLDKLLEGLPA